MSAHRRSITSPRLQTLLAVMLEGWGRGTGYTSATLAQRTRSTAISTDVSDLRHWLERSGRGTIPPPTVETVIRDGRDRRLWRYHLQTTQEDAVKMQTLLRVLRQRERGGSCEP